MGRWCLIRSLVEVPFSKLCLTASGENELLPCTFANGFPGSQLPSALLAVPAQTPPSTCHLGVSPVSILYHSRPHCHRSRRPTTPDKNATTSHCTSSSSNPGAQAMSLSAAAPQSVMPPPPVLKAPGVAQERKSTGEKHFANLSSERPKILVCTLKVALSCRRPVFEHPIGDGNPRAGSRSLQLSCSSHDCWRSCRGSFSPGEELRAQKPTSAAFLPPTSRCRSGCC